MSSGNVLFPLIVVMLVGVLAGNLAWSGVSIPDFWSILFTALAMGGVLYKWGDEV